MPTRVALRRAPCGQNNDALSGVLLRRAAALPFHFQPVQKRVAPVVE